MRYFRDKYETIANRVPLSERAKNLMETEYKYLTKTRGDNLDPYERSDEPARYNLVNRME